MTLALHMFALKARVLETTPSLVVLVARNPLLAQLCLGLGFGDVLRHALYRPLNLISPLLGFYASITTMVLCQSVPLFEVHNV